MALLDLMVKTGQAIAKGLNAAGQSAAKQTVPSGGASTGKTQTAGGDKGFPLSSASPQTGGSAQKTGLDDYGRTDYSVLLKDAMKAGASAGEVQSLLTKRTDKAVKTPGYSQYAYDDVYREAQAYINAQTRPAAAKSYDNSDYLRKQAAAEVESALAGLKGAYTKGMAAYDAQQDKLPERYQAAMNSAAAQSAMSQKAFAEQAAASGLNSGTSGQAALDAGAVYQGNLSNLHQARAGDMAELDRAKAALTAEYETAVAKAQAEGDASLAKALYQELIRVQGLERQDEQTAYDRGRDLLSDQRWDMQYADQKESQSYERQLQSAALMAQFGIYDGYAQLWGIPKETVNTMVAEYARQKQISEQQAALELDSMRLNNQLLEKQIANVGKNTGGSGSGTYKPPAQPEDIYTQMYNAGIRDEGGAYAYLIQKGYSGETVNNLLDYYMGRLGDQGGGGDGGGGDSVDAQKMAQFKNALIAQAKLGQDVNAMLENIWTRTTEAEQREITKYLQEHPEYFKM